MTGPTVSDALYRTKMEELSRLRASHGELVKALEAVSRDWHKVARHGGAWEQCDALCHGHRAALDHAKEVGDGGFLLRPVW